MAELLHSQSFTYDDYLLLPEDSPRCELIEGEFLMTLAPTVTHQTLLGRLFATIFNFLATSPIGTVLFAPTDVVLSKTTVVQPDFLFVAREHQDRIAEDGVHGPPVHAASSPSHLGYGIPDDPELIGANEIAKPYDEWAHWCQGEGLQIDINRTLVDFYQRYVTRQAESEIARARRGESLMRVRHHYGKGMVVSHEKNRKVL